MAPLAVRDYALWCEHGWLCASSSRHYELENWVQEEDDVDVGDWFTLKAQAHLAKAMRSQCTAMCEMETRVGKLGWLPNLQTLPGVGKIPGPSIGVEIGDVRRSPSAQRLAKYAGVVPQVQSSGGKTWRGPTSKVICNGHLAEASWWIRLPKVWRISGLSD